MENYKINKKDTQILDLSMLGTSTKGNYSIKESLDIIRILLVFDIISNVILFIILIIILRMYL